MANQTEKYLKWVKDHGGQVTLGEIAQTSYIVEYRRFHSELRQKGFDVTVKINRKEPGKNVYTIKDQVKFKFVDDQGVFA